MSCPIPAIPMPLTCGDVLSAVRARPSARADFEEAIRAYHGSLAAFAVSSARAALWLALSILKPLHPDRTRVLLPAYTCPTVGRAVLAAGLEGLCVDVSPGDSNLDAEQVEQHLSETVLAVIAAHMFGTPCDLPRLVAACDRFGTALIEDAAQACGARFAGRLVGSFGKMAVLSLGRSKNLRGAGGGVLLVNDPDLVPYVQQRLKHEDHEEGTKNHKDGNGSAGLSGLTHRDRKAQRCHASRVEPARPSFSRSAGDEPAGLPQSRAAGAGKAKPSLPRLLCASSCLLSGLRVSAFAVPFAVAKQLAVSALSTPHAWSLARRIPGLRIGAEDQSFDTRPSLLSPWQAALGTLALSRLDEYNALRTRLGQALEAELADVPGIHLQTKTSPRESAYVRLALRLESEDMPQHSPIEFGLGPRNEPAGLSQSRVAGAGEVQQRLLRASSCLLRGLRVSGVSTKRDAIARALQSRGIDARAFYTRTMPEYDWWQLSPDQPPCPQAKRLIASNLTLPLHYSMTEADVSRIARLISDLLSS